MGILISDEVDSRREHIMRDKMIHFILQSRHKILNIYVLIK